MSDITMCNGGGCDKKMQCHRYTAIQSEYWQSWSEFDADDCDMFWDNEGYSKDALHDEGAKDVT